MNTQNYASIEASKRLHDAGIILETDAVWEGKEGQTRLNLKANCPDGFPAPSMAEVLRKLSLKDDTEHGYTHLVFYSHGVSWVTNTDESFFPYKENNGNIIDALIDLLIFVRKEKP